MPEQYTITGTITPANGAESRWHHGSGLRSRSAQPGASHWISASDVRRGSHRCRRTLSITYTLEQFQNGEGISQFRRSREKNADLSFRVFDRAGQELNIKGIEAWDREYRADQIIFNAPTPLVVSIFLDAPSGVRHF